MDIKAWMEELKKQLLLALCRQVVFIGLQGSYARGEASKDSDIDVVVIFRFLTPTVLRKYQQIIDAMPQKEKVCGFVGSYEELRSWEAGDLFQLYYDTDAVYGDLAFIKDKVNTDAAVKLVHTGSCNLYHGCCHNLLHAKSRKTLADLYKAAVFVVQAKYFIGSGEYVRKHGELAEKCTGIDKIIVQQAELLKMNCPLNDEQFNDISMQLLEWSGANIVEFNR